jgi:hypothetical protein
MNGYAFNSKYQSGMLNECHQIPTYLVNTGTGSKKEDIASHGLPVKTTLACICKAINALTDKCDWVTGIRPQKTTSTGSKHSKIQPNKNLSTRMNTPREWIPCTGGRPRGEREREREHTVMRRWCP